MSIGYSFVTVLVIFAVLIGIGTPASTALNKAISGTMTDSDIARLPLSSHAITSHKADFYTAVVIQELLLKGFCSPKKMYLNCTDHKILFACKPNRASKTRTWALLVIGLAGWRPTVITGYPIDESRLDKTALKEGCALPAAVLP